MSHRQVAVCTKMLCKKNYSENLYLVLVSFTDKLLLSSAVCVHLINSEVYIALKVVCGC